MSGNKKPTLLPGSSAASRPPTDSLYPIQAPYGDLQGLTPPPEDFEELLRECHSLLPTNYGLVAEPPTPPRTESVSSPARSTESGGSSPPKLDRYYPDTGPSSPESDAVMENDMDFCRRSAGLLCGDIYDSGNSMNMHLPGIGSNEKMEGVLEYSDFNGATDTFNGNEDTYFDFAGASAGAASSPKPITSPTIDRHLAPQYHQSMGNHGFQQEIQPESRASIFHRKRARSELGDIEFDSSMVLENEEPAVDVKSEFSQVLSGNPSFSNASTDFNFHQNLGNIQEYNHDNAFPPQQFRDPSIKSLVPEFSVVDKHPRTKFPYDLDIDFPKFPRTAHGPEVKSRVETQIAVRFILKPAPEGISKIRLPRHAIAKIKYIEDSHPQNNTDILDLHATLVCASAMRAKDQLERAMYEARGAPPPTWVTEYQKEQLELQRNRMDDVQNRPKEEGDATSSTSREGSVNGKDERRQKIDYSKPAFGAVVQICEQCMNRERKRAGRKKNKKPDEEEKFAQDEKKRIIVFNTNQVRQFEPLTGHPGSIFAETLMRICCYCRHHGEKEGFRVIFTLKNHVGEVVAQKISPVVVITDDHKNTAASTTSIGMGLLVDGSISIPADQISPRPAPSQQLSGYTQTGFIIPGMQQPQEIRHNYPPQAFPTGRRTNRRSISPTSPMRTSLSPGGHQPKRRKSSKVPANLTMTPSDPQQFNRNQLEGTGMAFAQRSHGDGRPQWLNGPVSPVAQDENFFGGSTWGSVDGGINAFGAGLKSPSMNHMSTPASPQQQQQRLFIRQLPGSMQPAQSSNIFSAHQIQQFQQQLEQHHQNQRQAPMPVNLPQISRVVPSEGTCRGGIEITVLGRDFVQGLTIMFGDYPAIDTSFFSDTTLLCRLPPNAVPGPVIVSLKNIEHSYQQRSGMPFFTYIDDVEKELMALALTVVGMKMKGEMGTSKQIALSILRDNGIGPEAIVRNQSVAGNQRADLETTLLTMLDVIDMDESPHPATLGQRNKSGQTMLHLGCMLGMQKFVAALLARGVNANCRDKNGYTPLHFAALYKRSDVVRRLLMNRANAGIRTKSGETAADLGESDQIFRETRSVHQLHSRQHSRSSSVSSESRFSRSRSGSASSIVGLQAAMSRGSVDDYFAPSDDEVDSSDLDSEDDSSDDEPIRVWHSNQGSSTQEVPQTVFSEPPATDISTELNTTIVGTGAVSDPAISPPAVLAAWMDAWREHFAQSFQSLQLNMPTIPTGQTDYPTLLREQMARLQDQVPTMPRWGGFGQPRDGGDYKWSELLHPPAPPALAGEMAPPPYDELYPSGNQPEGPPAEKIEQPQGSLAQVETENSNRALELSQPSSSSPSNTLEAIQLQIARRDQLTEAQQAEYRAKIKRIQNDRRLYFFWIPILIIITLAMAYTDGPRVWKMGKTAVGFVRNMAEEPIVAPLKERLKNTVARWFDEPIHAPLEVVG